LLLGVGALLLGSIAIGAQEPPPAPPSQLTTEGRGDIFMARKMFREAIETYLQVKPQTEIIHNKIGIAYHQMTDLDTARKQYQKAIKANPKYAEAINNLGTVYYAKKDYRRAINQYKKALVIQPNSASMHSNLGTAYFARKQYDKASMEYAKALELDPEVFESKSSQGVLLQERTVEERAKFHYYLSKTYAKASQNERALQYMRKSIEEGFKEKKKYLEESEFAALRKLPEFDEIIKLEPRVL
jgi:tetratricopeptide (TPR) repeat protein